MPTEKFFNPRDNRIKVKRFTPKTLAQAIYSWFTTHRCTASVAIHDGEVFIVPIGKKNNDRLFDLPGFMGTYTLGSRRKGVTLDLLYEDVCFLPDSIQAQFDGRPQ